MITEIEQLRDQKIGLLGYGREGRSTHRFLKKHLPEIQIGILDAREQESFEFSPELSSHFGENYLNGADQFDYIFRSPGISLSEEFYKEYESKLISQTELFLTRFRKQTIGVTGTKGKSSTVSMLGHALTSLGKRCHVLGNIGVPALDLYDEIQPDDLVVFELSSHQLHHTRVSPHIAVLLNIYPEHLDYYDSFESYAGAKTNIFLHQEESDYSISTESVLGAWFQAHTLSSQSICIEGEGAIFEEDSKMLSIDGEAIFNLHDYVLEAKSPFLPTLNIKACLAVFSALGIALRDFYPAAIQCDALPHRVQRIEGVSDKIVYYNDSAASIPQATVFALNQIPDVKALIVGGYDRGVGYEELIERVLQYEELLLVFLPTSGTRIREGIESAIGSHTRKFSFSMAADLSEAVAIVREHLSPREVCLFSPASASYNMFTNYNERGEVFLDLISS